MWMYGPWNGFPWFPWMWILPLIFLVVVLLFFRGRSSSMCGPGMPKREETGREALDRRYALGEIDREQYLQMKKDIE